MIPAGYEGSVEADSQDRNKMEHDADIFVADTLAAASEFESKLRSLPKGAKKHKGSAVTFGDPLDQLERIARRLKARLGGMRELLGAADREVARVRRNGQLIARDARSIHGDRVLGEYKRAQSDQSMKEEKLKHQRARIAEAIAVVGKLLRVATHLNLELNGESEPPVVNGDSTIGCSPEIDALLVQIEEQGSKDRHTQEESP